jgi:uncharacterized damage-inducible protein DinB
MSKKTDTVILDQMEWMRKQTLRVVKGVREEEADVIPEGFNNNIRWNLGHIYLDQYAWIKTLTGDELPYPTEYPALFQFKTKPADWEDEPPRLNDLIQLLTEQPLYIRKTYLERLDDLYPKKSGMRTVRQVLVRTLMHEGMHMETIKLYKKLIRNGKNK